MSDDRMAQLTALTWPDGRLKIAPVQGYPQGIPWSLHLKAYEAYCKKYGEQVALIDLERRDCRGGFAVSDLDMFVPGWRNEVEELGKLRAEVARSKDAFRRGAEAMREAAAQRCEDEARKYADDEDDDYVAEAGALRLAAAHVRALPLPEDK